MTEPDDRETQAALRDMLSGRIGALAPPTGLYESVRRRHRHRQRAVLAGVLVLATGAIAVPAVALADRPADSTAVDRPADPRCAVERGPRLRPVPEVRLPAQRDAPGSLGGDPAVVAAVMRAGWQELGQTTPGAPPEPDTVRVRMVERIEGQIVGVVSASRNGRRQLGEAIVQGPDVDHLVTLLDGGRAGSTRPITSTFAGGEAFVRAIQVCGRRYVIAVAPPGTTGRASWITGITPRLRAERVDQAMPMRADGVGLVRIEWPESRVRLQRAGRVLFDQTPNGAQPTLWRQATDPELDEVAAAAPGDGNPVLLRTFTRWPLSGSGLPVEPSDRRVLWSGRVGTSTVALGTIGLPGGVRYVVGLTIPVADALRGYYAGLLAPGALERTVLAFRAQIPGKPLVAFAVGGVRAEAVLGTGEVARFALSDGGGVLETSAAVDRVRVYDADDRLIGEQVPERGLTPVPYETPV